MKKTTHLLKLFSFSAFWALLLAWVIFAKLPVQATTQSNILVNSSKLDNVSAALGQSATGTIAANGTIKGVISGSDGNPASSVTVQVYSHQVYEWYDQWVISYTVQTDVTGSYTVSVASPATYRVGFFDLPYGERYVSQFYTGTQEVSNALDVPVAEGQTVSGINVQLTKYGKIAGRITNEFGNPILYTPYLKLYKQEAWGWTPSFYSNADSNGDYSFIRLPDGKYRMEITSGNREYKTEFYNNANSLETATDITIARGVEVNGIDAQLSPLGRISGTVTLQGGSPVAGKDVYIYRAPANSGDSAVSYGTTDASGNYTAFGLETGSYVVQFACRDSEYQYICAPEVYNNAATLETGTPVQVVEGQTTPNINAEVMPLSHITGSVTDLTGKPIVGIRIAVQVEVPAGQPNTSYDGLSDINGNYDIGGVLPGKYVVLFQAYSGFYSEYFNNQTSVATANKITVGPGAVVKNINSQLTPLGIITGTIRDRAGSPIPGIIVSGYSYISDSGSWGAYYSQVTDPAGVYTFTNLISGTYRIGVAAGEQSAVQKQYPSKFYPNAAKVEQATDVRVGVSSVVNGIDIQMDDTGLVSGKVTNIYGEPLADIMVTASLLDDFMGATFWRSYSQFRTSLGSAGYYTVPVHYFGLPVRICFDGTPIYKLECYNNVANLDLAQDFTVATNKIQTGIDAELAYSPDINIPPFTRNDAISVTRGGKTSVLSNGANSLLANDRDPDTLVVQAVIVSNPLHGAVLLDSSGTFTYTHDGSQSLSDFFTYKTFDGLSSSNVSTVTVTVLPLVSFEFSKTVSILGIEPACSAIDTMKVPVTTTINYCYSITNSGDVPLTTHSLVDDKLGTLLNNAAITLAPGATHRVQFSQTLTVNTTNIATWTATSNVTGLTAAELDALDVAQAIKQATITISAPTDDQDGDTIPDNLESAGDVDGDNLPNFLDTDANGNSTPDASEAGANPLAPVDSNGNGVPDYLDLTAPNEGQNTKKVYLPVVSR